MSSDLEILRARREAAAQHWAHAHSGLFHRLVCRIRGRQTRDEEAYDLWWAAFTAWARAQYEVER